MASLRSPADTVIEDSKPRQALRDYALWHGQHRWIERLAQAGFEPAEAIPRLDEYLSRVFAQNPIGVEFDPDVLVAKFRAGVALEELVRQASTATA